MKEKILTKIKVKTYKDIIDYFIPYLRDMKKEVFKALLLDAKNRIINDLTLSEGTVTKNIVDLREVIKEAIVESSSKLILIHNHPSGEPQTSQDEIEITDRLISTFEHVGIKVSDDIIIYSYLLN